MGQFGTLFKKFLPGIKAKGHIKGCALSAKTHGIGIVFRDGSR